MTKFIKNIKHFIKNIKHYLSTIIWSLALSIDVFKICYCPPKRKHRYVPSPFSMIWNSYYIHQKLELSMQKFSPENSRTITHNYIIRPYIDSEKFRLYFNFDYNDSTFVNQFKYTFSHHIETILQMKSIDWSIIDWKLTH